MALAAITISASLAGLEGDPRQELEALSRLGYREVQLSLTRPGLRPRDLDGAARRALRGVLLRSELSLSGLDLWIPPAHFADPAHIDRAVSAAEAAIDLAAELERRPLSLALPPPSPERSATADAISLLLERAERRGVDLIDHAAPPSGHESPYLERLTVGIDPAACLAHGLDPVREALAHAARLRGARLCDLTVSGMRAPVTGGAAGGSAAQQDAQLDLHAFLAAVSVAALERGPIAVVADARQWSDPWAGFAQTIAAWQEALGASSGAAGTGVRG